MKLNRTIPTYIILFVLILTGCVAEKQYRTDPTPGAYDPALRNSASNIIEIAQNYTLGYVEFDDQGWLYDRKNRTQIDAVKARFAEEARTNGLLMIAFAHGWKHNAGGGDSNVVMFHRLLERQGLLERKLSAKEHRPARRVVGVYIGWRGLSQNIPYLVNLTFWDRKNTAEQVGHGAVVELLSELEALKNRSNQAYKDEIRQGSRKSTKLIIVGHSFGGDIIYSATAPILTQRMVQNYDSDGSPQPPRSLGNLVILINPAFEAARFETLQRLATTKDFPAETNCTLAVFTSTGDDATGVAFPFGRRFSTFFNKYRSVAQRRADITAVGHYEPFITYNLKVLSKEEKPKKPVLESTDKVMEESADKVAALKSQLANTAKTPSPTASDLTYDFTHCRLQPTTNCLRNNPVFNVAVEPAIIPDHNKIDQPVFIRFLSEFLAAFASSDD